MQLTILTELFDYPISARRRRNEGRVRLAAGTAVPCECLRGITIRRASIECVRLERTYLCRAQVGDRGSWGDRGWKRKASVQRGEENDSDREE